MPAAVAAKVALLLMRTEALSGCCVITSGLTERIALELKMVRCPLLMAADHEPALSGETLLSVMLAFVSPDTGEPLNCH